MQKILRIQCVSVNIKDQVMPTKSVESEMKRSLVEDITKKYTNIKLRKVSSASTEIQNTCKSPNNSVQASAEIKLINVNAEAKPPELVKSPSKTPESHRFFMCISCSEKFQKFSQLESHLKSCRTSSTQSFKCFCGKILGSKKELSLHVSQQHKQNKQQHICTICKKVFSSISNLQNHMLMHKSSQGTLKGIYMCHICNHKYPDLQSLKVHRSNCKQKPIEA